MKHNIQGLTTLVGRCMLPAIFVLSAVGNKIPQFGDVADLMATMGVPAPRLMLVGAIAFLIVGGLSVAAEGSGRMSVDSLLKRNPTPGPGRNS